MSICLFSTSSIWLFNRGRRVFFVWKFLIIRERVGILDLNINYVIIVFIIWGWQLSLWLLRIGGHHRRHLNYFKIWPVFTFCFWIYFLKKGTCLVASYFLILVSLLNLILNDIWRVHIKNLFLAVWKLENDIILLLLWNNLVHQYLWVW